MVLLFRHANGFGVGGCGLCGSCPDALQSLPCKSIFDVGSPVSIYSCNLTRRKALTSKSYLICLTIGPVFFAAAIYLTLTRIIVHYGTQHARISPKAVSLTFMGCDFVALVLQATGGAIADTAPTRSGSLAGTHIMVAGLAFQTLTLLMFIAVAMDFAWNVIRDRRAGRASSSESSKDRHETGQAGRFFKVFLGGKSYSPMLTDCITSIPFCHFYSDRLTISQLWPMRRSVFLPVQASVSGSWQKASVVNSPTKKSHSWFSRVRWLCWQQAY